MDIDNIQWTESPKNENDKNLREYEATNKMYVELKTIKAVNKRGSTNIGSIQIQSDSLEEFSIEKQGNDLGDNSIIQRQSQAETDIADKKDNSYSKLAKILEQALKAKFTETSEQMLSMMTDSSANFNLKQFLRSMLFHVLFMFLWVLAVPIMLIFVNVIFLQNTGFLPSQSKEMMIFFVNQSLSTFMWLGAWSFFVQNHYFAEDIDAKFDKLPLVIASCLCLSRFIHIAVRHGVTPPNLMLKLNEKVGTAQDINESLIIFAWLQVQPEAVLTEIDKACVRMQVAKETFTVKIISPLYPLNKEKFTDPNYYSKNDIALKDEIKQEAKVNKAIERVLFQFQQRGIYKTDQIRSSLKTIPEYFDLNCKFFQTVNFDTDLSYLQTEYDARLWLRELVMSAQSNTPQLPMGTMSITAILLALVPVALDELIDSEQEKPQFYWWYNGLTIGFNTLFYLLNLFFLFLAFTDANRRNYIMNKLSNSLEFDFHKKDHVSVRLPTINFLDTQSLLSWLKGRKLTLELGSRFTTRVQLYVSYYILVNTVLLVMLFALGSGFIDGSILSTKAWIVVGIHAVVLTVCLLIILLPSSYVNQQTKYQMKRLIFLKEVYQSIVRDDRVIGANPKRLSTKVERISITLLRNATANFDGEERFEKMKELAQNTYEALTDAIDELEKDVDLNPKKFLGIALYPDQLWSWFVTLATLGFGLIQQNFLSSE